MRRLRTAEGARDGAVRARPGAGAETRRGRLGARASERGVQAPLHLAPLASQGRRPPQRPPSAASLALARPEGGSRYLRARREALGCAAALRSRLATSIPGPRFHTVRYSDVLSAAAQWRPLIVPEPLESPDSEFTPAAPETAAPATDGAASCPAPDARPDAPAKPRSTWRPRRELLKRSFTSTGSARSTAALRPHEAQTLPRPTREPRATARHPRRIHRASGASAASGPRAPPHFHTRLVRRQPPATHDSQVQGELFDTSACDLGTRHGAPKGRSYYLRAYP